MMITPFDTTFASETDSNKPDTVPTIDYNGVGLPASARTATLPNAEGLRRSPRRRLSAELIAAEPSESPMPSQDGGGVHQLSSSPPRCSTQRSASSHAAQETQKQLGAGSDNFRQHMLAQHWIHNKVIEMLSNLVVASSRTIARSIENEGSLFKHIASNCPLEASDEARTLMGQFVEANVAALTEELRPEIDRLSPLAEGDVCCTGVLQILTDTRETLRQLVKFMEVRDRRNGNAVHQFRAYRRTMTRQFDINFDVGDIAEFAEQLDAGDTVCCVCDEPFTLKQGPRACVKSKCCSLHVCVSCFNKNAFNSSSLGCLPQAMCMQCRAQFPVYARLDAPTADDMNED
jgi:hypothetical protein